MKAKWISINTKMPILNEIIYYKGNLHGQEARYIGDNKVELKNNTIDRFDEWKPKRHDYTTFRILHSDEVTRIEATGVVEDGLFTTEYTHDGVEYGAVIPLSRIN
jgi:hypothetical protein